MLSGYQKTSRTIKSYYNTIIIGGGINGTGLFRDLALHNISTLLVDSHDFCSQTSQSSSKMLHGGIRYLETLDFDLVSEALEEKNIWKKHSPEHCIEKKFFLPNYNDSKYPLWALGIGLKLYDMLSGFRNTPSTIINRANTLKSFPQLRQEKLNGSGIYYDALVDDINLGLNCIWDGLVNKRSQAENYLELKSFYKKDGFFHLTFKDKVTDELYLSTCTNLCFCTGPFTDNLMGQLNVKHWIDQIIPNKGIHLWLKKDSLKVNEPMVLQGKDGRIIFVIPQRDAILVGTTEKLLDEVTFNLQADQGEILYLLNILNYYFPTANINESNILSTFAGIRPLVREPGVLDISKTSRKHLTIKPYENCYVIMGGKYTTFRVMVQDIARPIVLKSGQKYNRNATLAPFRQKTLFKAFEENNLNQELIEKIIKNEKVVTFEDLIVRRLSLYSENRLSQGQQEILNKFK